MCGIAGLLNLRGEPINRALLRRMTEALTHRGPEAMAVWARGQQAVDSSGDGRRSDYPLTTNHYPLPAAFVGLGHTRLRIIDVVGGDQPIWNEDGSCLIVFNGEIYNFRELRSELESQGHRFRTATDTETILHAYEEWGEECPRRLRGMFAFAIWNERDRGRVGEGLVEVPGQLRQDLDDIRHEHELLMKRAEPLCHLPGERYFIVARLRREPDGKRAERLGGKS